MLFRHFSITKKKINSLRKQFSLRERKKKNKQKTIKKITCLFFDLDLNYRDVDVDIEGEKRIDV